MEGSWRTLPSASAHPDKANAPAKAISYTLREPRVKFRTAYPVDTEMEGSFEDTGFLQNLPQCLLSPADFESS